MIKKLYNTKAFTLIELLVVVLIIGILAAIALPQYTKSVEKAKIAEAKLMIDKLKKAMVMCTMDNGEPYSATWVANCQYENLLDAAELPGTLTDDPCITFGAKCRNTKDWSFAAGGTFYASRLPAIPGSSYYLSYNYYDGFGINTSAPILCYAFGGGSGCQKVCGASGCTVK